MRKIVGMVAATALLCTMSASAVVFAGESPSVPYETWTGAKAVTEDAKTKVTINGQVVTWKSMEPVNVDGTVWVPIREALEAFGQKVSWNQARPNLVETNDLVTGLQVTFDMNSALVKTTQLQETREMTMSQAPKTMNQKTMVSVRALTEIYGKVVVYDRATATVLIRDYNGEDDVYQLNKAEVHEGYVGDVVKVHYATDGTYDMQPTANKDFLYVGKEAEGVGNHCMYFKALTANKDSSIVVNQVADGKVVETTTYQMMVKDPAETAVLLSADQKTKAKVGTFVKVVLTEQGASTGYVWAATSCDSGLGQTAKIVTQAKADMPGAPNTVTFLFQVIQKGEQSVTFDKQRPWEKQSVEHLHFVVEAE